MQVRAVTDLVCGRHQGMRVFCCLSAGSHFAFSLSIQVQTPLQQTRSIKMDSREENIPESSS